MSRTVKLSGFAAALVAAALFGAVALNTASAAFPPAPSWDGTTVQACPWGQVCSSIIPTPESAPAAEARGEDGGEVQAQAIECSITDGCEVDVTFVTDDGEIAKRMIITLVDPEPEATPDTE